MMMTFITEGGEGLGKTNKKRTATKSNGSGLEDGASRALTVNCSNSYEKNKSTVTLFIKGWLCVQRKGLRCTSLTSIWQPRLRWPQVYAPSKEMSDGGNDVRMQLMYKPTTIQEQLETCSVKVVVPSGPFAALTSAN